ncbi:hypothetical protein ARMSODRAFT_974673 [Armillaria solidipes]|uniref:Uncharacterized protein n=1 Tax=Armillaria solidipes TaxID=1076256 RepID=A0A2H3C230_9AGAR|nr:hypothetical protein ARMSODRAFT_974673 [Armillaria solidipes]
MRLTWITDQSNTSARLCTAIRLGEAGHYWNACLQGELDPGGSVEGTVWCWYRDKNTHYTRITQDEEKNCSLPGNPQESAGISGNTRECTAIRGSSLGILDIYHLNDSSSTNGHILLNPIDAFNVAWHFSHETSYLCLATKDDTQTIGQAAAFEGRNTCLVEDPGIESPMEGRACCHTVILQHAQRSSFL